jgi:ferredoxin
MNGKEIPFHFVSTRDEARKLIGQFSQFWVSNCGCREAREGQCQRSRADLCLMFRDDIETSGSGKREISLPEVEQIFQEAEAKHLVTRPFRDEETRSRVEGICFCCDDCCAYFQNEDEVCQKGGRIEQTDFEKCIQCGVCEDVCYFGARQMDGEELTITREKCYGCGLCVDVCPVDCVEMVERE